MPGEEATTGETSGPPAAPPDDNESGLFQGNQEEGTPGLPPLPPLGESLDSPVPGDEHGLPDQTPSGQDEEDPFFPPSGERAVEAGSPRPAHETDPKDPGPSPGNAQDSPESDGFEIERTLRNETPSGFDPSGFTPDEGLDAALSEPDPEAGWGNIAIGGPTPSEGGDEDIELAGEPSYEPPPPVPTEEPPVDAVHEPGDGSTRETSRMPAYQNEVRSSGGGGRKAVVVLLLLGVLGGAGYFAYPTVMRIVESRIPQVEGTLTPSNIQVKALTRADGKIIYSVRGVVRNESATNVGMVQVEAQFRNESGDVLSKATSYCGNLLEESQLLSLDLKKVQADLQNELGQSLSNASITPGMTVPFLVVLDNPPSGISKVTVSITSFKETT